jgi:glyoxylase-like metal-dependent hydrolase (beta-lactamase superfamily II)
MDPRMRIVRRVLAVVGLLLLVACLFAGAGLLRAHRAIAREGDPLPGLDDVAATVQAFPGDAAVALSRISTSSQVMGDGRILGHPSFVLRWRDGRLLLVDLGMTEQTALSFGVPFEWVLGAQPAVFHGSTAAALGADARNVRGVVFTHLHTDHVDGVREMCAVVKGALNVLMTPAQATRPNYTTRPGLRMLHEARCVLRTVVEGTGLRPLADFPGVFVFHAGGHTPGSQIVFAALDTPAGRRGVVFSGDITNDIASIDGDLPKPWIYRNLLIPEAEQRQGELRRFLRALRDDKGMALLVAHDERNADRVLAELGSGQS